MKPGKPSYTAEVVACYRAVESLKPEGKRVCYDPFAIHFLRTSFRLLGKLGPLVHPIFWLLAERGFSGDVAQGIGRTRYIDDYLRHCIADGIRQVVILGAGYDSRAYRIEGIKDAVTVFELDHSDTQNVKKEKIVKLLGGLPAHVVYVPIDFSQDNLGLALLTSGYGRHLKTLFICEGMTYFLAAEEVDRILAFVRDNSGEGSSIIFDYAFKSVVDGDYHSEEARRLKDILAEIGEPYTFGIGEGAIGDFLAARGFCDVTEVSAEFLTDTYFRAVGQNRRVAPFLSLVHATVKHQVR